MNSSRKTHQTAFKKIYTHHLSLLPYKRMGRQTRSTISTGPDSPRSWVEWIVTTPNCSKSQATPKTSRLAPIPLLNLSILPCALSQREGVLTMLSADLGLSLYYFCTLICWPEILFRIPVGPVTLWLSYEGFLDSLTSWFPLMMSVHYDIHAVSSLEN